MENLNYEDVEGEGGDHRCPRMGSIYDGDDRWYTEFIDIDDNNNNWL